MTPFQLDAFTQDWADGVCIEDLKIFHRTGFSAVTRTTSQVTNVIFPKMKCKDALIGGYQCVYQPDRLYLNLEKSDRDRFAGAYSDFFLKESEAFTAEVVVELGNNVAGLSAEYLADNAKDIIVRQVAAAHKAFVDINMAIVNETLERYVPGVSYEQTGFAVYLMIFVAERKTDFLVHAIVRLNVHTAGECKTYFFGKPIE